MPEKKHASLMTTSKNKCKPINRSLLTNLWLTCQSPPNFIFHFFWSNLQFEKIFKNSIRISLSDRIPLAKVAHSQRPFRFKHDVMFYLIPTVAHAKSDPYHHLFPNRKFFNQRPANQPTKRDDLDRKRNSKIWNFNFETWLRFVCIQFAKTASKLAS